MRSVLTACVREWRRILGDPGALLLLVVAAGLYGLFYPQPYLREVLVEVPTVVVDHDGTPLSRRMARMADAGPFVQVTARTTNRLKAEDMVRRGEAGAMLEIPKNFERDILRGESATVACFTDAAYFLVYRQATTGLVAAARTLSAGIEIQRLEAGGMTPDQAGVVEDLITAAHNDAKTRAEERMQEEMSKLTGGLELPPGFKLPI